MHRYVAFLRGINLGKRRPPMSRLKELFEGIGFAKVETFIASGNVLFSSRPADAAKLEANIEKHLAAALGYEVDTFVRTAAAVAAIGRATIFPEEGRAGITVHVGFFQQELPAGTAEKFSAVRTPHDEFQVAGKDYYWLCRIPSHESKVWTRPEIKALKLPSSSMRNLTSIRKLVAKHIE